MDFSEPTKRAPAEPFVPMINVVFLLLIFFLMTAQIIPPNPFETTPPVSEKGAQSASQVTLYVSAQGVFGYADLRGPDAVRAARDGISGDDPLRLSADAAMPANTLAHALHSLAQMGIARIELVTLPQ